MDDYTRSVRLRAYLIWERAGQRKAVMLNIGIRRKGKWRRKRLLLACGRRVRTTRVSRSSKNPAESKQRLKWPSRHLRARREMSSNGRRKLHNARAKVMMLPVDARLS